MKKQSSSSLHFIKCCSLYGTKLKGKQEKQTHKNDQKDNIDVTSLVEK
jgi:hypothetical protein